MVIQPKPGTYALILSCTSNARIQIGRLGTMQLQRGYYVYLGSALGPGGLRARIAHHQKLSPRPHWHIDYLRAHTPVTFRVAPVRCETTRARVGTRDAEDEGRNDPSALGSELQTAIVSHIFTSSSVARRGSVSN